MRLVQEFCIESSCDIEKNYRYPLDVIFLSVNTTLGGDLIIYISRKRITLLSTLYIR